MPFTETVELKTYDQRLRWTADPQSARPDVVLVEIDETSVRRLEPLVGRWPWPRLVHSSLIDYLARGGARVVAYDVLFVDRDRRTGFDVGGTLWTGEESDRELARATARAGNVVHLAEVTFEGLDDTGDTSTVGAKQSFDASLSRDETIEERPTIKLPYDELARASRAIGHNYMVLDQDGPVRRVVPFVRVGVQPVPVLSIAAAMVAERIEPSDVRIDSTHLLLREKRMPLVLVDLPMFAGRTNDSTPGRQSRRALVDFHGPAVLPDGRSTTYKSYSFYDLFYSQQQLLEGVKPLVDPAVFRDKIVLVGTTAAGLHDVFTGPFGNTGKMAGIHIHAAVIDDVLSGRFMRPAGRMAGVATTLLCGLSVGLASAFFSVPVAVSVTLLTAAALGWVSLVFFKDGVWLPLAVPLLAVSLAVFTGVAYQYFVEGREKRRVKKLFGRYVSKEIYEQLLADPALARLGGQRREMTVLFSDIRGFTSVSERGQPEHIVAQLNEFFSRMVQVIFRHHGTVDKFVGDMVMALFGAPLDDVAHADNAVRSAVDMVRELETLNSQWAAEGKATLEMGVGINTGEMIAGNIGSEAIMSYTVIGDAVNLGARLESLNKEYGTKIIIGEATRTRLKEPYNLRPLGEVVVKGKSQSVAIYEVKA